jgi:hypothetical protein
MLAVAFVFVFWRRLIRQNKVTANGLGLCDVGEFQVQMFNIAQKFNRITNAQFSTSAPILPNPC